MNDDDNDLEAGDAAFIGAWLTIALIGFAALCGQAWEAWPWW